MTLISDHQCVLFDVKLIKAKIRRECLLQRRLFIGKAEVMLCIIMRLFDSKATTSLNDKCKKLNSKFTPSNAV